MLCKDGEVQLSSTKMTRPPEQSSIFHHPATFTNARAPLPCILLADLWAVDMLFVVGGQHEISTAAVIQARAAAAAPLVGWHARPGLLWCQSETAGGLFNAVQHVPTTSPMATDGVAPIAIYA